jgi:hypothetical protein
MEVVSKVLEDERTAAEDLSACVASLDDFDGERVRG